MESEVVLVKMAEIDVVEDGKRLKTTLGSCVGLVLHDPDRSISGLAHIVLPEQIKADSAVGKYANTAIPALLSRLLKRGCRRNSLKAYVAGGANMFFLSGDRAIATVGEKNVEAVKRILTELGIEVAFEDTGGSQGRTVVFNNRTGEMEVKTLGRIELKGDGR